MLGWATLHRDGRKHMARIPLLQETDPTASQDSQAFLAQAAKARGRRCSTSIAPWPTGPRPAGRYSELIRTVYRSGLDAGAEGGGARLPDRHRGQRLLLLNTSFLCSVRASDFLKSRWATWPTIRCRTASIRRHRRRSSPMPGNPHRLEPIDDETYGALARHFTPQQEERSTSA